MPLLSPAPREIVWKSDGFDLSNGQVQAAGAGERRAAEILIREMERLHDVALTLASQSAPMSGRSIRLVLESSPGAGVILETLAGRTQWPPPRNPEEGYLLEIGAGGAVVFARSQRGLIYGCQTLLQLVTGEGGAGEKQLRGVRIADYPQLPFRGVHICIFPNTELAAVRQMILLAARFKYNAVVLEFWSSLKSRKRPESAYENTYTPGQIRPLVRLGQALEMEMIPMLNSWGHASGMRSRSGEHAVLDRFPEHKDLFEPNGWSFDLTNPAIYDHLFDRYDELLELFAPVKHFHIGLDEAWGHLGVAENRERLGKEPHLLIARHLNRLHEYFSQRNIRMILWHDMFLERDHPQLGRQSPANSFPPFNTHLALPGLPRDVIIAAWNYAEKGEWPVPRYFHAKGFPVVVCPWKTKGNTIALLETAKKLDLLGVLATTWDSLDVCQPSVGRAGVLAWTAPGYDLGDVPFEHWLQAIRGFPICALPKLETILNQQETNR